MLDVWKMFHIDYSADNVAVTLSKTNGFAEHMTPV